MYIHGYDVITSELGGFNVHLRHTYNFVQGSWLFGVVASSVVVGFSVVVDSFVFVGF